MAQEAYVIPLVFNEDPGYAWDRFLAADIAKRTVVVAGYAFQSVIEWILIARSKQSTHGTLPRFVGHGID